MYLKVRSVIDSLSLGTNGLIFLRWIWRELNGMAAGGRHPAGLNGLAEWLEKIRPYEKAKH